jgi:hypothetical protein
MEEKTIMREEKTIIETIMKAIMHDRFDDRKGGM